MRGRMGKWGSLAIVGTVMIWVTAAVQGQTKPSHKPAAMVNGEPIMMEEVDAILKHEPPSANPPTEIQRRQMQLEALSLVIDDRLVQQFLRNNGPTIPPAEVHKKLAELESSLKIQGRTMNEFLKENGLAMVQLQADTLKMLQW